MSVELERALSERDLYRELLELGTAESLEPLLIRALNLIVRITGAHQGYLELSHSREARLDHEPEFWVTHECSDAEAQGFREKFSRGIIAEAIARCQTISTASAVHDPRFADRGSVKNQRIAAVLCAPIGGPPPLGVVYLQGRDEPGEFEPSHKEWLELFARQVGVYADRLTARLVRRTREDETQELRKHVRASGFIGRGSAAARLLKQVSVLAPGNIGVLLTGPTGVGKSQLARLIHDNSHRAQGPFVELNCAAVPEDLLENELFGADEGAHSTATKPIMGKIAAAHKGTLFLDEIGELALRSQAKLLTFLESKEYFRLGSTKLRRVDVRLISATNCNLDDAIKNKTFREDLYYRVCGVTLRVPSLAERREDIQPLAEYFCSRACETNSLPVLELSVASLTLLRNAVWRGNIRELAHVIEAGAIQAAGRGLLQIEPGHLFPRDAVELEANAPRSYQEATREFQAQLLRQTLAECEGNVSAVARRLDLARSHVYNLLHSFGIERGTS